MWWKVTRSVQSRLIGKGWQCGPDKLSSQQVLKLPWISEYTWDLRSWVLSSLTDPSLFGNHLLLKKLW